MCALIARSLSAFGLLAPFERCLLTSVLLRQRKPGHDPIKRKSAPIHKSTAPPKVCGKSPPRGGFSCCRNAARDAGPLLQAEHAGERAVSRVAVDPVAAAGIQRTRRRYAASRYLQRASAKPETLKMLRLPARLIPSIAPACRRYRPCPNALRSGRRECGKYRMT